MIPKEYRKPSLALEVKAGKEAARRHDAGVAAPIRAPMPSKHRSEAYKVLPEARQQAGPCIR
jgi:hypothetical protein